MSERQDQLAAGREAKAWFDRLGGTEIRADDIEAWFAWSRDPLRWAAYQRIAAHHRQRQTKGPFSERDLLAALERRPDLASAYQSAFARCGRPSTLADIAHVLARKSAGEAAR